MENMEWNRRIGRFRTKRGDDIRHIGEKHQQQKDKTEGEWKKLRKPMSKTSQIKRQNEERTH